MSFDNLDNLTHTQNQHENQIKSGRVENIGCRRAAQKPEKLGKNSKEFIDNPVAPHSTTYTIP